MIECDLLPADEPVRLTLGAGQRIVTLGLEPVMGWTGPETARAQALVLPPWLLKPCATANIAYACVLPAPAPGGERLPELPATAGQSGAIKRPAEAAFLAGSIPGGQVTIVAADGSLATVAFRWGRVAGTAAAGALWRCFLKLRPAGLWTPAGQDYLFDPGSGALVTGPAGAKVTLGKRAFKLSHPDGELACVPSRAGRVKVTYASADGWGRRELAGLSLYPDRSIVARLSDGTETRIATAAPAFTAAMAA